MLSLTPTNKKIIACLTFLILPISGLAIDIYVPSLPAVSSYFHVNDTSVQLTISTYLFGLGISQLFAGPLSDRYGRRIPFAIAMAIFIVATLLIPLSNSIDMLTSLRALQGAAVGVSVVPLRSVTMDLFKDGELSKMINYMTISWSIGPIIAPAIGGYLQHYAGWKASFYALSAYSVVTYLIIMFLMPETSVHRQPLSFSSTIKRYITILRHPLFFTGLLANTALYSLIILFSVVGPFLLQDTLKLSAVSFGHYTLLMGCAWFLGNTSNRFLITLNNERKISLCLWMMLLVACVMLGITIEFPPRLPNIVIPILVLLLLGGIIFPNNFAMTLKPFPEMSGSANALGGSLIFFLAGLSGSLGAALTATNGTPLAITYVGLIVFSMAMNTLRRLLAPGQI